MTTRRAVVLVFAATAITAGATPSFAQLGGDGFLFRVPRVSLTLRGGFDRALANSDVFAFVTEHLTLDRGDFSSVTLGSSLGLRLSSRTDIVLDVGYASTSERSEFRDWIDQNDQPIEQTTTLRRVPVTVGVKHYLASRGRAISRFAWIPTARAIYVGAGAGMMHYRFHQIGDFVDFETLNVFPDEFESSAWTPVLHALAGVDVTLGPSLVLTGEGRYTWARGAMGPDYVGFDRIDLSGLSLTAGVAFRF